MSHLRPIQGGFDSVLIAGPKGSGVAKGMKGDRKGKGKELFVSDDVLASEMEVSLQDVYGRVENVPRELQGLQPDMDPHLRQALEALEDDAFVDEEDDGEGGEWWGELIAGGEADEYEREEYEFREEGLDEEAPQLEPREDRAETWEDRFKAFKNQATAGGAPGSDEDIERSEMADTIGSMVSGMDDLMVRGGKKRRGKRGPSEATGMSMSSSSMFRNTGLRDLDSRFDKVSHYIQLKIPADRIRSRGIMSWKTMKSKNGTMSPLWQARQPQECPTSLDSPELPYSPQLPALSQKYREKTSMLS